MRVGSMRRPILCGSHGVQATQASPGKHRRHQPAYSAGGEYALPDSPARHSRSGGSSYGSPSKSLGHQSPEGHQQRRLQRQLARRVHGVLPPEQRYMPPSSRKGTDDAARRALIAHLKEVLPPPLLLSLLGLQRPPDHGLTLRCHDAAICDPATLLVQVDEAMDRINKGTRSRRPPSQTQRLKACALHRSPLFDLPVRRVVGQSCTVQSLRSALSLHGCNGV